MIVALPVQNPPTEASAFSMDTMIISTFSTCAHTQTHTHTAQQQSSVVLASSTLARLTHRDAPVFSCPPACLPQHTKREGLVQQDWHSVLVSQFHLYPWQPVQ